MTDGNNSQLVGGGDDASIGAVQASEPQSESDAAEQVFLRLRAADRRMGVPRRSSDYYSLFDGAPLLQRAVRRAFARDAADELLAPEPGDEPLVLGGYSYRLSDRLGGGGQADVYRAVELHTQREVALKVRRAASGGAADSALRASDREARLGGGLPQHRGICDIFGAGFDGGYAYLAMRLVDGASLAQLLAAAREKRASDFEGPLRSLVESLGAGDDPKRCASVLALVEAAACAVAFAHDRSVVHRDLKPGNLMVDRSGAPVLVDFGAARATDTDRGGVTTFGAVVGTPAYMAPEQHRGEPAGQQADVWALGAVLFECLTLRPPFTAPTPAGLRDAVLDGDAPVLRRWLPRASRDLQAVVETALRRDPAERYATAAALAEDLRRLRAGEPVLARRVSLLRRAQHWMRRNWQPTAVAAAMLALVGLGWWSTRREMQQTELAKGRAEQRATELAALHTFQRDVFGKVQVRKAGESLRESVRAEFARVHAGNPTLASLTERWLTEFEAVAQRSDFTGVARAVLDSALVQPAFEDFEEHFPRPSETAARARRSLGEIAFDFGLYSKAAEQLALAVEMWTTLPEHDVAALCETINELGLAHLRAGDADAAAQAFAHAQELGESSLGELHPQTIAAIGYAAYPLKRWGRLQESAAQVREAIHRMRRAGKTSGRLYALELNLAQSLRQLGELEEAEALLRSALAGLSRAVGPESVDALGAESSLAMVLLDRGRAADALASARRAADGLARVSGRENDATLSARLTHSRALHALGRCDESLSETAAVLASYRRRLPADHETVLAAEHGLALTLQGLERFDEARRLLLRQFVVMRGRHGPDHTDTRKASASLAELLLHLQQSELAADILDEALESATSASNADTSAALHLEELRIAAALQLGRIDQARERAERALERATLQLGANHRLCGSLRFLLQAAIQRGGPTTDAASGG